MNIKATVLAILCVASYTKPCFTYDPGLPAAVCAAVTSLVSAYAALAMHKHPQTSDAYTKLNTIRTATLSLLGPLFLLIAYTASDNEQRARIASLLIGIPWTVASSMFWLKKIIARYQHQSTYHDAHTPHANNSLHMDHPLDNLAPTNL